MATVNSELKKIMSRVKTAQNQFQNLVKDQAWVDEAKKYAERQGKEVRKLINTDVEKVKTFLEKERKELEKVQKQIPSEVKKFQKFVTGQRKELEKLLEMARSIAGQKAAKPSAKKGTTAKRKAAAPKAASAAAPKKATTSKKKTSKKMDGATSENSAQA